MHEVDGFTVTLRGRADGVFIEPESVRVEEVKAASESRPAHRFQLRLYALALAERFPERRLDARLVLAGEPQAVRVDRGRILQTLDERVRELVAAARQEEQRAAFRTEAADALAFPHGAAREGQQRMMEAIENGLAAERPVLVSAPTGTGKTVAAMLPALRHALRENATLLFLTAKTTQQALAAETFASLAPPPGIRALTLRAKSRMCPPETLHCHPRHCVLLRNFLDEAKRRDAENEILDPGGAIPAERVYSVGAAASVCPYALSLALTKRVEMVIGDVNYAYSSSASLDFGKTVVVVDEAHNLFDRAREDLSPFLDEERVKRLKDRLYEGRLHARSIELFDRIERFLGRVGTEDYGVLAEEAAKLTLDYAAEEPDGDVEFLGLLRDTVRIRDLLAEDRPEFVAHENESGRGVYCLDPAAKLAERHALRTGTVAMSATLEPLDHFREVLGFRDLAPIECRAGPAFPAEHRRVVAVPGIDTTYKKRGEHYGKIAKLIRRVVDARPGHYVAYFPSFTFLESVRGLIPVPRDRLVVQHPSMSTRQRDAVLKRLRTDEGPVLLLAVLGGIFGEGIDLPGEALVGAIIVGPGLPQTGPERNAMKRHFDEVNGRGFLHAFVYPGMQRVVQAAGRVHRAADDRGVIVLLGKRFRQRPYKDVLPDEWEVESASDPVPLLEEFWETGPP